MFLVKTFPPEHSSGAEQSLSYWQRTHAHAHLDVCVHTGVALVSHWCSAAEEGRKGSKASVCAVIRTSVARVENGFSDHSRVHWIAFYWHVVSTKFRLLPLITVRPVEVVLLLIQRLPTQHFLVLPRFVSPSVINLE